MKNEVFATVTEITNYYVNNALQTVVDNLPTIEDKEKFQANLKRITDEGFRMAVDRQDFDVALRQGTITAARLAAETYTEEVLHKVADKLSDGHAKDYVESVLQELSGNGIASICNGADMEAVMENMEVQLSHATKEYLKKESQRLGSTWINSITDGFKDKGRGKGRTTKNRAIKKLSDSINAHLYANISNNLDELWQGNKSFPTALKDVALGVAEGTAVDFATEKSKEIANNVLKTTTKKLQKEIVAQIGDKTLKKYASKGLKKISSLDGIVDTIQDVKAITECVGAFLDGRIDRTEFMQNITDKAANAVSEGIEKIATVLAVEFGAGPLAPIVGQTAGYVAGCVIRKAVAPFINAARRAKAAKEHYELIHELSQQSIIQMREQRRLFEQEVEKMLSCRQDMIEKNLSQITNAIVHNDANKAASALNNISKEFGGNNKLSTFEEFDDFVLNSDEEIVW